MLVQEWNLVWTVVVSLAVHLEVGHLTLFFHLTFWKMGPVFSRAALGV